MSDYIHGSTDPIEIARLEKQAKFCAPWFLPSFDAAPGMRVLDLGTGIGAMAEELHTRFPGILLTGLDHSAAQLSVARERHPFADYVRGDAAHMPFDDASFDRVHASWLLEHVPDPSAVVQEVRRVLRPGGLACFVEVDNATLSSEPSIDSVRALMAQLDAAQIARGGDPYVGRKLTELFTRGGFLSVEVAPHAMHGSAADPAFFRAFVEEFAEIFESVDEVLGPTMHAAITLAVQELRALPLRSGTSLSYAPVIVRAFR